jgi:hypothetical protein
MCTTLLFGWGPVFERNDLGRSVDRWFQCAWRPGLPQPPCYPGPLDCTSMVLLRVDGEPKLYFYNTAVTSKLNTLLPISHWRVSNPAGT